MEPNENSVKQLANALEVMAYGDAPSRKEASQWLANAADQPGIAALYVRLLATEKLPEHTLRAAVVQFYSLIKNSWNPEEEAPHPELVEKDKEAVRASILEMFLSCGDDRMSRCLCDAIGVIARDDYVYKWPELLPKLRGVLCAEDKVVRRKALRVLHQVCKLYRGQSIGNEVVMRMLKVLENVADRVREMFAACASRLERVGDDEAALEEELGELKLLLEVFYSLNGVDLPKEFSEYMDFWMGEHHRYISMDCQYERLVLRDDGQSPGVLTRVKRAAVRNMSMYLRKYEDDFEEYIQAFAQDAWKLLEWVEGRGGKKKEWADSLVMASIEYLTRASQSSKHAMFADMSTLRGLCVGVVVPNVSMSAELYENFEGDPLHYIEMDMKGADTLTRRHAAMDLVLGLRKHYESQVTEIALSLIQDMLKEYEQNPEKSWISKDSAIYLITAISAISRNYIKGVLTINPLVPLNPFFHQYILPELQQDRCLATPVVKADCLRFVVVFWRHLSIDWRDSMIPLILNCLKSQHVPVVSYASIILDAIATSRDPQSRMHCVPIDAVLPHLESIFGNLFAVGQGSAKPALTENTYVGSAIAHLISYSKSHVVPYAVQCLTHLTNKLSRIYRNPIYPDYIHYLFEAISSIIKTLVVTGNASVFQSAETHLLPAFLVILGEDIMDLTPYVFQIVAQLMEAKRNSPDALLTQYGNYFPQFTSPTFWERVGNIPALTRLLVDYIHFVPAFVAEPTRLSAVLGIFNRLQKRRGFQQYSFQLVQAIFVYMDQASWNYHALKIYHLLLDNLGNNHHRISYVHPFISFVSCLFYAKGASFVLEPLELVRKDSSQLVINLFVESLPTMPYRYYHDVAIGTVAFLSDPISVSHYEPSWLPLLCSVISMLTACKLAKLEDEKLGFQEAWTGEFSKLSSSDSPIHCPIPPELDECVYISNQLKQLASSNQLLASKIQSIYSTDLSAGLQEIMTNRA
ncbi:exportin-2-like [Schistocerca gregaria]|uniref:exportin-2-like n=1 Tax=Schistocerca gregaria TaxID=7010 RepID=UPI00211EB9DF|nr:exportin-2-like [Schistocerca gregaria]